MSLFCSGVSAQCETMKHINQDDFGFVRLLDNQQSEITAAIVADGVSNSFNGKYASYNTVRWWIEWAQTYFADHAFELQETAEQIQQEMEQYNDMLNAFSEKNSDEDTCCTVCGIITDGTVMIIFNAGDSRAYEIQPSGKIRCLTQDDVGEDGKSISMHIGGKNKGEVQISFFTENFNAENKYLLCTDGMYRHLRFADWHEKFFSANNRKLGVILLTQIADFLQDHGELDDITGILLSAEQEEQDG